MGDKNPKSKQKNMKQKESHKASEMQKAQVAREAKSFTLGKPKK